MDSSLDTRLRGLTDISSMVIEFLDMVLRNLQRRKSYASSASNTLHYNDYKIGC